MIPAPHRMKGGALLLGAHQGEVGPFGPYGSDTGDEDGEHDQAPAEPTEVGTGR
ncbi:hypothetical protein [Streptomyces roseolus]|uniref:hypothetical protein n=1 Tax=Streptomyces roseolus TaxID=67358 RepID=UPI00378A73BD